MAKRVISIYPLFQSLARAREVFNLKLDPDWIPASEYQKAVLQFYRDFLVSAAQIPDTDAVITQNKDAINDLIRTRKYDEVARLVQEITARAYGIATALKLDLTLQAQRTEIESKFRTKYRGAYLTRENVRHYRSPYLAQLIPDPLLSTVETAEGYILCFYACPSDLVADDFLLYELTTKAFEVNQQVSEYAGLRLPLVQFQHASDMKWIRDLGMRIGEDTVWNAQLALQLVEFRLKLTEEKVEPEAAPLSFTLKEKDVVLDGPFVFSVWKEELERPILVGHVSSKDWLKT